MKLVVHPLTPERWPDLETLFNAKGCSVARGCWCMYYRVSGKGADTRPSDAQLALSKRMFDQAGFQEVARRKPARPVVRLQLIN